MYDYDFDDVVCVTNLVSPRLLSYFLSSYSFRYSLDYTVVLLVNTCLKIGWIVAEYAQVKY